VPKHHTMKTHRDGGRVPHFLDLTTRCRPASWSRCFNTGWYKMIRE